WCGQLRAAAAVPAEPHGGASGRVAGAGATVAGVASGLFAGRGARWLTTTHWLTSNRARTIRNRTARTTIVTRLGTWITRGPREESLCAVVSRSQRGKRVISRAAIVPLSGGVAELLGKPEISPAKARAATSTGSCASLAASSQGSM